MKKNNNQDFYVILKNFLFSVFILMSIAVLIIATQYAGDKAQFQIEGEGYEKVDYEELKNSCINFFGVVK